MISRMVLRAKRGGPGLSVYMQVIISVARKIQISKVADTVVHAVCTHIERSDR